MASVIVNLWSAINDKTHIKGQDSITIYGTGMLRFRLFVFDKRAHNKQLYPYSSSIKDLFAKELSFRVGYK